MKAKTSETFYKFLQKLLSVFDVLFLGMVKGYLNTQVGQGFLKKIVNWLAENVYDQTIHVVLEVFIIKAGYKYDVREGKVFIERLKDAQESGNVEDWNDAVDDINS
jgi:ribosome-binding factor A